MEGEIRTITNLAAPAIVTAGNPATITATLNGALAPGQGVYLRYTTDAFATSTIVAMTGAATSYSANIPGMAQGTEVKYYCFTSGNGLAADITHSLADFYTINSITNGGLNYGFTVQATPAVATIANGNWSDASTWEGGNIPNGESARAIVRHAVGLNTNVNLKDLDVEAGGSLLNTNHSITIHH